MALLRVLIPSIYQIAGLFLIAYGTYLLVTLTLFILNRRRHDWPIATAVEPTEWPSVTVQLPIYNEPHVAERVVRAAAALDYPDDRLQIQVLDDSTDLTSRQLARLVDQIGRQRGIAITHNHRTERGGYKAGALAAAFPQAAGEYIVIFDSDFVPPPDWLRRTLPAMLAHPELAFLQTRWEHLNAPQSWVTMAQAVALDGHFVIEQQARSATGLWQNFNGSGGIWRREAIAAAGGWTADTVTEDLDLSYRAQLGGWRGGYLNQVAAPGELPPLMISYKRQQRRWAKGSAQTLRKLARPIWASPQPLRRRLYAFAHLGGYATHLPLLLLLLLTLPIALMHGARFPVPMLGLASSMLSVVPILLYAVAQQQLRRVHRLMALPILALLSLGLSSTLALAVIEGLRHGGGAFDRTPKQGRSTRRLALPEATRWRDLLPEACVFVYAGLTLAAISWTQQWQLMLLPLFFIVGSGLLLLIQVHEQNWGQAVSPAPTPQTVESGDAL